MTQSTSGERKEDLYLKLGGNIKCKLVGDAKVGKTSMLLSYHQDEFSSAYDPTIFDNWSKKVKYNDRMINLLLYDTGGSTESSQLGQQGNIGTDIFLLCFSVDDHASFKNISEKWKLEVEKCYMTENINQLQSSIVDGGSPNLCSDIDCSCQKPLILLVGCKADMKYLSSITALRKHSIKGKSSRGPPPISVQQGEELAREIGAYKYMECCARNGTGVNEIFNEAIKAVLNRRENASGLR